MAISGFPKEEIAGNIRISWEKLGSGQPAGCAVFDMKLVQEIRETNSEPRNVSSMPTAP